MCSFINALPRALLTLLAAWATNALAWGAEGHRLIAELAQWQLTPAAVAEVDRLLALEPGATMATVSTWADEKRALATAPLHYVNLPEGRATTTGGATAQTAGASLRRSPRS